VAPGEIFAIVGPSGAGKTTLLRCIDFLLRPEAGDIRYDGQAAPSEPAPMIALRRRIGMVAQNPYLFRGTASYNVSFGLCIRDVDEPELSRRTADALKPLGLSDLPPTRA